MIEHFQISKGDGGWCNCGKRYPCGSNHCEGWPEKRTRLERLCELPAKDVPCQDDIRAALERVQAVEGAMRADDKRLEDAAIRVWGEHRWGCDTPDQMADLILSLRQRVEELERERMTPGAALYMDLAKRVFSRILETPIEWGDREFPSDIDLRAHACIERAKRAEAAEAKLARCVEALGEIRGRSLAAKTHEVGPLEAKGRLTRILELACAALAAAKGRK